MSRVEHQLTSLQKSSKKKDIVGSKLTFGVQELSSMPCFAVPFHSKLAT